MWRTRLSGLIRSRPSFSAFSGSHLSRPLRPRFAVPVGSGAGRRVRRLPHHDTECAGCARSRRTHPAALGCRHLCLSASITLRTRSKRRSTSASSSLPAVTRRASGWWVQQLGSRVRWSAKRLDVIDGKRYSCASRRYSRRTKSLSSTSSTSFRIVYWEMGCLPRCSAGPS